MCLSTPWIGGRRKRRAWFLSRKWTQTTLEGSLWELLTLVCKTRFGPTVPWHRVMPVVKIFTSYKMAGLSIEGHKWYTSGGYGACFFLLVAHVL